MTKNDTSDAINNVEETNEAGDEIIDDVILDDFFIISREVKPKPET